MNANIPKLVTAILICQFAGIIGSIATFPAIPTWYASLNKPWFTPPSWLFGPVWITLYTLMGISLYLVWQKGFGRNRMALYTFGLQLALNSLWSLLFFGLQSPFLGLVCIILLWVAIAASIVLFYRISKPAGLILIPYICWVSIATALNYFVFILN